MEKISMLVGKKIDHFVWMLVANGILLMILGVLIVWTDFMLRLVMGLIAILISWVFLYGAYKLWHLKKILDKYLKF
jgi:hypothetical protein